MKFTIVSTNHVFNPMAVACQCLLMGEGIPVDWITDAARAYSLASGKLHPNGFAIAGPSGEYIRDIYQLADYLRAQALTRI